MKESLKQVFKTKLIKYSKYLIIAFFILMATSLIRNILRIRQSGGRINRAEEKVEELKQKNQELAQQLETIKSDQYIEKQIRDNLGLVKEGEVMIILPEDEILDKLAPVDMEEQNILPDPNWKKWLKLFF